MKIGIVAVAVLSAFTVACGTSSPPGDKSGLAAADRCSEGRLNIHIAHTYIFVTPMKKCVDRGETYTVKITGHQGYKPTLNGVEMVGPGGGGSFLSGKNSVTKGEITFTVPDLEPLGDQKYDVDVPGVGHLDPAVRIR